MKIETLIERHPGIVVAEHSKDAFRRRPPLLADSVSCFSYRHGRQTLTKEVESFGMVNVYLGQQPTRLSVFTAAGPIDYTVTYGDVVVQSASEQATYRLESADNFAFFFDHALLEGAARTAGHDRALLRGAAGLRDPLLTAVLQQMQGEIRRGPNADAGYFESLSRTLLLHLVRHYATTDPDQLDAADWNFHRLLAARDFIVAHLGEPLTLARIAKSVGLSPYHFARLFRRKFGLSPHAYIEATRVNEARRSLRAGNEPLAAMAYRLGFASQAHFTDRFRRAVGMTPLRYRQADPDAVDPLVTRDVART